jgi:hypothetical protein
MLAWLVVSLGLSCIVFGLLDVPHGHSPVRCVAELGCATAIVQPDVAEGQPCCVAPGARRPGLRASAVVPSIQSAAMSHVLLALACLLWRLQVRVLPGASIATVVGAMMEAQLGSRTPPEVGSSMLIRNSLPLYRGLFHMCEGAHYGPWEMVPRLAGPLCCDGGP